MRGLNDLLDGETVRLPRASLAPVTPEGFALCPVTPLPGQTAAQWQCQQALYLWAFQQAQAAAQPSLPERDLAAAWN